MSPSQAISKNYPLTEAVSRGVHAGVDVLLFCHETENADRALEFLCREAGKKEHVRARIEESYRRISHPKVRYLPSFTTVRERELGDLIDLAGHQKIVEEIKNAIDG